MSFLAQAIEVPQSAMQIAGAAYIATLLCLVAVELYPLGRRRRIAAMSLIALALTGGTAWSYAALYERSNWPQFAAHKPVDDGDGPVRYHGRSGGEIDPEDAGKGDAGDDSDGDDAKGPAGSARSGGKERAIILSQTLGLAGRIDNSGIDPIIDCDGCPPMVMVPAGSDVIGAADDDETASSAERPRTEVRFWPGFLISMDPVDTDSFETYMSETNARIWSCGPRTASLQAPDHMSPPNHFAGCVMPADADGYAAWLSARTGHAFRVPTAAEWEYAARALPGDHMSRGDVAEIAADCWHAQIPLQGRERIAARTPSDQCDGRTVMGRRVNDAADKLRLSQRSKLGARETRAEIGFRVMRAIGR